MIVRFIIIISTCINVTLFLEINLVNVDSFDSHLFVLEKKCKFKIQKKVIYCENIFL